MSAAIENALKRIATSLEHIEKKLDEGLQGSIDKGIENKALQENTNIEAEYEKFKEIMKNYLNQELRKEFFE